MLSLVALALADAWPVVYAPGGMPWTGEVAELVVLSEGLGSPASAASLRVSAGALVGAPEPDGTGGARVRWLAPPEPGPARLEITEPGRATIALPLAVRPRPAASLVAADDGGSAPVGAPVDVLFRGDDVPLPTEVEIVTSEGRVANVEAVPGGLRVRVAPGPERAARVLAVGLLDQRRPGQLPSWATVRLRSRQQGQVTAEPGSRLSIKVGSRNYGPFVADATGTAAVSFDAYPGESSYELLVADDLGNSQRLQNPIPHVSRPVLLAMPRRGGLFAGAWDARGSAWGGTPPSCRAGAAANLAVPVSRGTFAWSLPAAPGMSDVAAACTLGDTVATLRVPLQAPVPTAIALRLYPEELSSDFPLAELQATLVDAHGDRQAPEALRVEAARGTLVARVLGDSVRAEYDGRAAAAAGGDEIVARWDRPPGRGLPHRVALCGDNAGHLAARVLDAADRPLPGVSLAVSSVGPEGLVAPLGLAPLSDARGYATGRVPAAETTRVRVTAGAAEAEALVGPGARGTDCLAAASPSASDLVARVSVAIRSGRVRQLFLEADPTTLPLEQGARATLRVRMFDAAGAVVTDEPVVVEASEGTVSAPSERSDGTVVATFTPAAGSSARTVQLTASAGGTTVATSLELVPRPVRGSVAASVGYLSNLGGLGGPLAGLAVEHRLPFPGLAARGAFALYGMDTLVDDEATATSVPVSFTFFPVELGVVLAQRDRKLALAAGISAVLVPYALDADFGDGGTVGGTGLAPPGARLHGAAGYRLGQAEVFAEVGYLLFTLPAGAVTLSGNAGGLSGAAGYRVLY